MMTRLFVLPASLLFCSLLSAQPAAPLPALPKPILLDGREYNDVTISQDHRDPSPTSADGMWLVPLKTPVMTTGMSPRALAVLREQFQDTGMIPMQGGGVASNIPSDERNI